MRVFWLMATLLVASGARVAAAEPCGGCHAKVEHGALGKQHPGAPCAACHGGDPDAKSAEAAHKAEGDRALLDATRAYSTCTRCHSLGAIVSDAELKGSAPRGAAAIQRGADALGAFGCVSCHPVSTATIGVSASGRPEHPGPSLARIGLRGPAYLSSVLEAPAKLWPKTAMPSYAHAFHQAPARARDLMVFLLQLRPERQLAPMAAIRGACTTCHARDGQVASGKAGHRCAELRARPEVYACARCHGGKAAKRPPADEFPSSVRGVGDPCLYQAEQRPSCLSCHGVPADVR